MYVGLELIKLTHWHPKLGFARDWATTCSRAGQFSALQYLIPNRVISQKQCGTVHISI